MTKNHVAGRTGCQAHRTSLDVMQTADGVSCVVKTWNDQRLLSATDPLLHTSLQCLTFHELKSQPAQFKIKIKNKKSCLLADNYITA